LEANRLVQWNRMYPKYASLRWHYPNQVPGIFSVLNSQNTPCFSLSKLLKFIGYKYYSCKYFFWNRFLYGLLLTCLYMSCGVF